MLAAVFAGGNAAFAFEGFREVAQVAETGVDGYVINTEIGVFQFSAGGSLALEKASYFSMKLETLSKTVKAGETVEVSYILEADEQTKLEVFAPVGWTASVADGKVTVAAPADAAAGISVQVVVFATRTDGESVCQVLNVTVE